MIYEFAVEPELVAQWNDIKDFRYFAGCFGLGLPRMVSEFPKVNKWRAKALNARPKDMGELDKKRVEELVRIMSECMVKRERHGYDGNRVWLENAEADHVRCPFHLILARENPRNKGQVRAAEVIAEPGDETWECRRTLPVPRTPEELARALEPMLSNSSEIHFIDPHFKPYDPDYQSTLEAFLQAALDNRGGSPPSLVEVILDATIEQTHFETECRRHLPRRIPKALSVQFRRLKSRGGGPELHNRYLLSDIGGVFLGRGLDRGDCAHSEDMALLEKQHYLQRWGEYVGPAPAYDLAEEPIQIIGRA